ncbi:F-box protein SKIP23 [Eucalyptus grandis]|uniref:F-box protein SKIP23 n=1 Tax=Eucalyptus grandis TaxID=71139 RepID=UPI00052440E5|nr:F-box protein SKIP23 [Eucalyptus grandis]
MERNWADLLPELLGSCSQGLCPNDLSAFRAVCRSWRSAAVEESSDVPWLMLADKKGKRCREFFCLQCQRVHKKFMPEVKARRCFSSRGWVLTIGRDWELHMLKNPMSRGSHIINLPNLNKFPNIEVENLRRYYHSYGAFINKFVISDSPTTSPDFRVMVTYYYNARLGLWKPGDEEWTKVDHPSSFNFDVIFYRGCFYALNANGHILRCDVNGPTPSKAQVVFEMPRDLLGLEQMYLVQSTTGSLLVVSRRGQYRPRGTFRFHVFEIDLVAQSWRGIKTLKNSSLFLGWNSSFSLEVDEKHHIKPNCIYFTDDFIDNSRVTKDGGGKDMGIYHLQDGTIEPHFQGKSYSHYSPPLWIEPNF